MTTAEDIKFLVCDYFKMEPWKLVTPFRGKHNTYVRHMTMFMLRKQLDMTYVQIGKEVRRATCAVKNGVTRIENELDYCAEVQGDVGNLTDAIIEWEEKTGTAYIEH